tara:strand:+ start:684 stop:998 length:315 start_codon:yes stop_codon:yes gene_type:complete
VFFYFLLFFLKIKCSLCFIINRSFVSFYTWSDVFGGIYIGIWLYERHQKNKPAVVISSKSLDEDLGEMEDLEEMEDLDDLEETKGEDDEFSGDEDEDDDDEEIF